MGRPREFDVDEALGRAMGAFWERGFEGTSMTDLMSAMGLHKGSIYKAFGDKQQLFERALQSYLDDGLRKIEALRREAGGPAQALRRWLDHVMSCLQGASCDRGCFAVNATCELGARKDLPASQLLDDHWARMEAALARIIGEAQERGELRANAAPSALASFIVVWLSGMQVLARRGWCPDEVQAQRALLDGALGFP